MKKIGKEILRHGIWIVIILFLLTRQCGMNKKIGQAQIDIIAKENIIKETKDKLGRTQSTVKTQEIDFNKALRSKEQNLAALKEDIKGMNVRVRSLKYYIKNIISVRDTFKVELRDTILMASAVTSEDVMAFLMEPEVIPEVAITPVSAKTFNYMDKWIDINGLILDDSITIDYNLWEEHTLLTHYSRRKWHGARYLDMEFKSENPNSHLITSEVYYKKIPKPLVSFGFDVGYGATFTQTGVHPGPYLGVGAHFPIYTIYRKK